MAKLMPLETIVVVLCRVDRWSRCSGGSGGEDGGAVHGGLPKR